LVASYSSFSYFAVSAAALAALPSALYAFTKSITAPTKRSITAMIASVISNFGHWAAVLIIVAVVSACVAFVFAFLSKISPKVTALPFSSYFIFIEPRPISAGKIIEIDINTAIRDSMGVLLSSNALPNYRTPFTSMVTLPAAVATFCKP
jgi:hypothetical protein